MKLDLRGLIRRSICAAAIAGSAIAGLAAGGRAQPTSLVEVPADIPIGPADQNAETSRGLSAIMDNCIVAYSATRDMHAEASYVSVIKADDEETSYVDAHIMLDFHRPGKLAIVSKSATPNFECSFIADGTTVTMSDTDAYLQMPQPESLAAFSDSHRAGEVYDERSGTFRMTAVAAMLVSDNLSDVLLAGISRYIYEGKETLDGVQCHRLRFIQANPDVIVILWVDENTWLIRKTSFISSYDADYNMVDSFDEGVNATMMVTSWDKISTDSASVNEAAFSPPSPAGRVNAAEVAQAIPKKVAKTSLWDEMVAAAASASPETTTWSLVRDYGAVDLRLAEFAELPGTILDFTAAPVVEGEKPLLAVAMSSGTITMYRADGTAQTTVTLKAPISDFAYTSTTTSGPMLLATSEDSTRLTAYTSAGAQVWTYGYPYSTIRYMNSDAAGENAIYLSLGSRAGIRKLDENGHVLYADRDSVLTRSITPAPSGINRVLCSGLYELGVMDKDLNIMHPINTEETLVSILWDTENTTGPIVDIGVSQDADVLLQRRSDTGDILWTTMIAPKAKSVNGSGLKWVMLKVDGVMQRCLFIMLSDGQIVITSRDGKVLFRGSVSANDALVKRNEGDVLQNIATADLDGDGITEVYAKIDNHLMQLTTPQ